MWASPTKVILHKVPSFEITTRSIQTVGNRFCFQLSNTTELRKRARTTVVWWVRMEKRGFENINGRSRSVGCHKIAWISAINIQSPPLCGPGVNTLTINTQFPSFPLSFLECLIPREMAAKERLPSIRWGSHWHPHSRWGAAGVRKES